MRVIRGFWKGRFFQQFRGVNMMTRTIGHTLEAP